MPVEFFHRLHELTPTRFWVNNPTLDHARLAIAAGAVNCTTNPACCSTLLATDAEYMHKVIDDVVALENDDNIAAERAYFKAAQQLMHLFLPLYEQSNRRQGYVTIQGDPRSDSDPRLIVADSVRCLDLAPNFMAKIPVTKAGCEAMEELIARGVPICATEVFAVSQAVYVCELYERVSGRTRNQPPFYVTHITGILDEYWKGIVESERIAIAPEILLQAGCAVARKEYRILKQRGYKATMLGGGARGTRHFTEFIGADMHITINWSTAVEIDETHPAVDTQFCDDTPIEVVRELEAKLPGFRRAYNENALELGHFADFGGVIHFRNQFMRGYSRLLEEVAARRMLLRIACVTTHDTE